jgi:hypothetical protein
MLLADNAAKYPEQYGEVKMPTFDADQRKRLDGIYGKYGNKPWSSPNPHERVDLIEHYWKADKRVLHFFRDIAQRENNQTLHVSGRRRRGAGR